MNMTKGRTIFETSWSKIKRVKPIVNNNTVTNNNFKVELKE